MPRDRVDSILGAVSSSQAEQRTQTLAALSLCTDLANGLPLETGMRTAWVGVQIARNAGMSLQERSEVFLCGLLRFLGCTAYAHEEARLAGGDDIALRREYKDADRGRASSIVRAGIRGIGVGRGAVPRSGLLAIAAMRNRSYRQESGRASCDVAVRLAQRLGASEGLVRGVEHLQERWDGRGEPHGVVGEEVSAVARVVHVASVVEHFARRDGIEGARAALAERRGGQLDPTLVDAVLADLDRICAALREPSIWDLALDRAPTEPGWARSVALETIAEAFADFVDLQSVYTLGHSVGVGALAHRAARAAGMSDDECATMRLSGLLHDLGRVGVPTGIWEKAGRLSSAEWERVRLHPYQSERILACAADLTVVAKIAGAHHERPDGQGYHRGVARGSLALPARLLAAADSYHAMREPRPHRPAFGADEAARNLRALVQEGALDHAATEFVLDAAGHGGCERPSKWPHGLTDREVDVLRELARGGTNRDIAHRLQIGERTVRHHVAQIYVKAGVGSRAGAALFALERGLLTLEG